MEPEILLGIISLAGSGIGAFVGIVINSRLTNYRIEQLEKKVEKHNSVMEKTIILERDVKVINHRIDDLEGRD